MRLRQTSSRHLHYTLYADPVPRIRPNQMLCWRQQTRDADRFRSKASCHLRNELCGLRQTPANQEHLSRLSVRRRGQDSALQQLCNRAVRERARSHVLCRLRRLPLPSDQASRQELQAALQRKPDQGSSGHASDGGDSLPCRAIGAMEVQAMWRRCFVAYQHLQRLRQAPRHQLIHLTATIVTLQVVIVRCL